MTQQLINYYNLYTVAELRTFASRKLGIALASRAKKAEIVAAIVAAQGY